MNYFIAGTDTGVGKTTVASGLLLAFAQRGHRAAGMKPVAAGYSADRLTNDDAELLRICSVAGLRYQDVNPYLLKAPTSPHIAARLEHQTIEWPPIADAFAKIRAAAEVILVEGVGGWYVPLSPELMSADIPKRLDLPTILVAGIRLGAINHTLLTAQAIRADGCYCCGWIANIVDPHYGYARETIDTLVTHLAAPCLAEVPWIANPTPQAVAHALASVPSQLERDRYTN